MVKRLSITDSFRAICRMGPMPSVNVRDKGNGAKRLRTSNPNGQSVVDYISPFG
jgi:hypothetical protein